MKRHSAQKSIPAGRVALVSLLLAVLWPAGPGGGEASTGAPIGRFVIGVYKPAGWSGGGADGGASPQYDRFFTAEDARNLNDLGVNLTISTPHVTGLTNTSAPDTTQKLEAEILKRFGLYGGYVVEQPSEGTPHDASGNPWPSGLHLLDFAGNPSILGHPHPVERANNRNRLGAQVDSLAAKWTLPDSGWADGFFGYFIGHESDPKGKGGIYDSATYPHLKTVIDSIRNHDTERAIVAVGNAGDTGKWTPGEQTAFRQAFFRPSTDPGPANILMNEQYILSCGSNTDAKVRDRIDRALLPSLNRARTMVDSAHLEGRKAEWYHIVNVNNEYKSSSSCWTQCADGRRQPHYRQPSRAELKAQAHLALARGATGIVYFAYTSKPDTSALASGRGLPQASALVSRPEALRLAGRRAREVRHVRYGEGGQRHPGPHRGGALPQGWAADLGRQLRQLLERSAVIDDADRLGAGQRRRVGWSSASSTTGPPTTCWRSTATAWCRAGPRRSTCGSTRRGGSPASRCPGCTRSRKRRPGSSIRWWPTRPELLSNVV